MSLAVGISIPRKSNNITIFAHSNGKVTDELKKIPLTYIDSFDNRSA